MHCAIRESQIFLFIYFTYNARIGWVSSNANLEGFSRGISQSLSLARIFVWLFSGSNYSLVFSAVDPLPFRRNGSVSATNIAREIERPAASSTVTVSKQGGDDLRQQPPLFADLIQFGFE